MTETGMSLGTPTYMSPEQAMGEREITARSDVYALGCVLYEMLAGEPPFTGPTAQAVVARVMTEEPRSLRLQRKSVPPRVEATVMKALEKLPADRFAGAADFADALHGRGAEPASWNSGQLPAPSRRSRRVAAAPWALVLVAAALAAWGWLGRADESEPMWNYVSFGGGFDSDVPIQRLALSPDGRLLALKDGRQDGRIWIKSRDQLDPVPVPGTERGQGVTFSPDGAWLAFLADGQLKKVQLTGGAPITIADSAPTELFNVAWLSDGTLVYATQVLRRVSSSGGESTVVMNDSLLQGAGLYNLAPLPDARGVLFGVCNSGCVTVSAHVLDLESGEQKLLVEGAFGAWYLPDGHLLYARRDGVVLAAPFDLDRLEITGTAVPVLQNVLNVGPVPMLAWSPSGTMVYMRSAGSVGLELVRVPRDGGAAPVDSGWAADINSLALAPDGRRLAVGAGPGSGVLSIFVKRLDRGPFSRLTFGAQDRRPAWSPDGRTVAFIRDSAGGGGVYARVADGTGADRLIGRIDRLIQEFAWSGDGRWLVVRTDNGARGAGDLVGVPLQGDTAQVPLVATPFTELHPAVSPDSKWLAYTSNESGANEVYVRPFPNTGDGRWQVSNGGGFAPVWSPDGSELFFLSDLRLMAAQVRSTQGFDVTGVQPLFDVTGLTIDPFHQSYAVEPGGRTFLFLRPQGGTGSAPSTVLVEHWLAEVAARMAQ